MSTVTYVEGASLPDTTVSLFDRDGLIDFSTGFVFEVRVGPPGATAAFTKASDITGSNNQPNISIAWSDTEVAALAPGFYQADLEAIRDADDRSYKLSFTVQVKPAVG